MDNTENKQKDSYLDPVFDFEDEVFDFLPNVPIYQHQNTAFFPTVPYYLYLLNTSDPFPRKNGQPLKWPIYPERVVRSMADTHAEKMETMAKAQSTEVKPVPASTATKTCKKCRRSYPEDQFLNKRGGAPVKLCDTCRNTSRISHKKRRGREAAEREAKKARAASFSAATQSPSSAPVSISPTPQTAPYFQSPDSDTSPGRMLMQNLSNVANQGETYPEPEPISNFGEGERSVDGPITPIPVRQRSASAAVAAVAATPRSPFLNKSDTHENLLAKFGAKTKDNHFGDNDPELGVHLSVPHFGVRKVPDGQMEVKEEAGSKIPDADIRYGADSATPNEQYADLHFNQLYEDGQAVRVDLQIVCKFTRYRTCN